MKRIMAWLLVCLLMTGMAPAHALTNEEALNKVSGYLTEVYSYTQEEAEKFQAYAEFKQDGWLISYWHQDHPGWIYTAVYDDDADRVSNAITPFYMMDQHPDYPGEGTVREGLNRARKYGWFSIWEPHMQQELQHFMAEWGIKPTARLKEGLSTGKIAPGNALHEYFVSCYGDEMNWMPSLQQWHDAELEAFGLTVTPEAEAEIDMTEGVFTYQGLTPSGQKTNAIRFIGEVPRELETVFSHPQLAGWNCLCGATVQNESNDYGHGLAAFEKDGRRLLVALRHQVDQEWELSPVSKQALYTDKEMYILADASSHRDFVIVYRNSDTETERFEVTVAYMSDTRMDASIDRYVRMDEKTGNGIAITFGSAIKAITYENHRQTGEAQDFYFVTSMMSMMDITEFPTTLEELQNTQSAMIPEGYALCRGVHLRKKTSSRSKDLGEYNSGVLVKVLGVEPGSPDPWYHVQVGVAEGYMSSRYVDEGVTENTAYALAHPLPVAQATREIKLKKGMSLFAGTIQTVPEGTQMQVLADCDGGWLHVCIPQGDMQWTLDLNGVDGYIKKDDVRVGGTPLTLEWME